MVSNLTRDEKANLVAFLQVLERRALLAGGFLTRV